MSARVVAVAIALATMASGLSPQPCTAQCDGVVPRGETRDFRDLYQNLQAIECAYALDPQPAPALIGYMHITTRHGPLQAALRPTAEVQPDGSLAVTVYGMRRIIGLAQDRSQGDVAGYSFQPEITEIRNANGVVFAKRNVWDNWPLLGSEVSGNVLTSLFDVGDATEVAGVIHASTVSSPGSPSQRALDQNFRITLRQGCVGVFMIPALPVALLYAPPPGDRGANTLTYSAEQSVSTTVRTTLTATESRQVPGSYDPGFDTLKSSLSALKSAAKVIPGYGSAIAGCLDFINEGLGTQTVTNESGTLNGSTDGLATTMSQSTQTFIGGAYPHGPFKGEIAQPGLDDKVAVLLDVRMAWIPDGPDNVKLMPLGPAGSGATYPMRALLHDLPILEARARAEVAAAPTPPATPPSGTPTAGDPEFGGQPAGGAKPALKLPEAARRAGQLGRVADLFPATVDTLLTPFDLVTVTSLLALNPLAPAPGRVINEATLSENPRYRAVPMSVVDGQSEMWEWTVNSWDQASDYLVEFSCTVTQGRETTAFTTTVRDDKPGLLGQFLGIGPQERQTLKSTSIIGTRAETATGTTRKVKLHLEPPEQGALVLRAYEDLVFGTYVFHQAGSTYLQGEGVAMGQDGVPAANQWVTLAVDGRNYTCLTDAQGRYAIYASSPPSGAAQLRLGTKVRATWNVDATSPAAEPVRKPNVPPPLRQKPVRR